MTQSTDIPDDLIILDEPSEGEGEKPSWKILIADDEEEIHKVTKLALSSFEYDGRDLEFLSAYSGAQTIELMQQHDDIALVLLDVVMEEDDAGLNVIKKIRDELQNHQVRIVLRTGQPGQAPQKKVVSEYDINDYRAKSELTVDNLYTVVYTGLRMYKQYSELKSREKELDRSNKDLTRFAHVVSHDLKAPLRTIASYSELLEKKTKGKLDQSDNKYLQLIIERAKQMSGLIEAVLTVSRVNTQQNNPELLSLNTIVSQAISNLDADVKDKAGTVNSSDLPDVMADSSQLVQLFQNLIANALKFQREGTSPEINISCEDQGEFVEVRVTDNGIGVSEAHLDRIFQIFARLHSVDEYAGTGIGLSICKKIVERHGGNISVKSEPGQGSTFIFTLRKEGPLQK